jgi:xanthine dehydrogenase accessory factor
MTVLPTRSPPDAYLLAALVAADAFDVLRYLENTMAATKRACLVTLVSVAGASSRRPGALMAVAEDGAYAGSFSGGCVEAAVVAEALDVIAAGRGRTVRFGEGSRYIDIRLPCGGALDLVFSPDPPPLAIRRAVTWLEARRPLRLTLATDGAIETSAPAAAAPGNDHRSSLVYRPRLRLVILGHGDEVLALTSQARVFGAEIVVAAPDQRTRDAASRFGCATRSLLTPGTVPALAIDRWTAIAFLFHDHDWEPALLAWALDSDAFFVGAMGSARTHATRVQALRERGVTETSIERLAAPLGLIPHARDPATLAVSALAEIVTAYEASS